MTNEELTKPVSDTIAAEIAAGKLDASDAIAIEKRRAEIVVANLPLPVVEDHLGPDGK